jgi:hypothetical protein
MWDLWWIKRHWGSFPPRTSVSPAKCSTDCSTLIIIHHHPALQQLVDLVPLHPQKKKKVKSKAIP